MDNIKNALAFRTGPTTLLVSLIYVALFSSVLITDELPNVPKRKGGLDLEEAYRDLHHIAARPHPFISHENDVVRSYILDRVSSVAQHHTHVHVVDDLVSNASYVSGLYGVYFEGTNVLVKVDGTDPETAGVLFSAHYDSVSSASGATDDGMGVATLIQLIEYLSVNQPKRTAVFNINNGEEDFLNGAHVFLEHPWASRTDTFLNLEGASAGGRPVLFRATSTAPALSFLNKHVPHPHANVLSADAFSRGVIRSGTDYQVYTAGPRPMEGLDLAFYKGRSKYHTKYDAIPYTYGQEKSLWAMMEAAKGAGLALLNDDKTHKENSGPGVYFDLFAAALIVFPLRSLYIFNIVSATVGPLVLILLVACEAALQHGRRQRINGDASHSSIFRQAWVWFVQFKWLSGLWQWAKFWVAAAVTVGLQALLILGYVKLNPYIAYSYPYVVFLSSFSLAYLALVLILNLPIVFSKFRISLPEQQKNTILIQTYVFSWILLVASTVFISKSQIGGLYFITMWNILLLAGSAIGSFEGMIGARGSAMTVGQARYVEGERIVEEAQEEDEATEHTPLIRRNTPPQSMMQGGEETGAMTWWILQALIVVPVPVILVSHIAVLLITAMSQSIADGGSPVTIYTAISLIAFLFVLPLAPFSVKLSNKLTAVISVVFIASTAVTWLVFPFSPDAPLKIYFQQKVHLRPESTTVTTYLTGVGRYLPQGIVTKLPSTINEDVLCVSEKKGSRREGLTTCSWNSTSLSPSPGGSASTTLKRKNKNKNKNKWIETDVQRLDDSSARISVKGVNTRGCRIYFDNQRITAYDVHGAKEGMQKGFELDPEKGITELRVWSRTWDRNFTVDVRWENVNWEPLLKGKVGCEWAEYESGSIGVDTTGKIPAYEEALTWFPPWAVVTKANDGLVEVFEDFSV